MITEDPSVFFNLGGFAVEVLLSKADASLVVETTGIPENAVMEESSSRADRRAFHPQITVPTADAQNFGEGDRVNYGEQDYEILDDLPDGTQTTFTLEEI